MKPLIIIPKLPHKRQRTQKWLVGSRVRVTKLKEFALRDVPFHRLTATGVISKVYLKFPKTAKLYHVVYSVTLDTEILGEMLIHVVPGYDSVRLQLI